MSISRKRRRELHKLRKLANNLLDEQRVVLGHAGSVLSEAGYQAKALGNEHISPRINRAYKSVQPAVENGVSAVKSFGRGVRDTVTPFAAAALTRSIAALEAAENRDAAKALEKFGTQRGLLKRKNRAGGVIALVLGGVAAAAVGYSLWQSFRDDEDVWVAPESEQTV